MLPYQGASPAPTCIVWHRKLIRGEVSHQSSVLGEGGSSEFRTIYKTSWANARVKLHSQVHIEFLTCSDLTCLPDLTLPDLTLPDLTLPELTCPNLTCPDLTCPNLTCPYWTCPYLIHASFINRPTMLSKRSVTKRPFLSYRKLLQKLG